MKKRCLIVIFILVVVIGFICYMALQDNVGAESSYELTKDLVKLEVGNKSTESLSYNIINLTEDTFYVRDKEILEKYKNGEWYKVLKNTNIVEVMEISVTELKANETKEDKVIFNNYQKLKPGKYRIVKEIYKDEDLQEPFYVAAEFNVS